MPQIKEDEYRRRSKHLSARMLAGLASDEDGGPEDSAPQDGGLECDSALEEGGAEGLGGQLPGGVGPCSGYRRCEDCGPDATAVEHPSLGAVCSICRLVLLPPDADEGAPLDPDI